MRRSRLLATLGALVLLIPAAVASADEADEKAEPENMSDLIESAPKTQIPAEAAKNS